MIANGLSTDMVPSRNDSSTDRTQKFGEVIEVDLRKLYEVESASDEEYSDNTVYILQNYNHYSIYI